MKKVLLTGSEGFIGSYVVKRLLELGFEVVGIDNFSKYGKMERNHSNDPNYKLVEGDVKDYDLLYENLKSCDYFIAGAAMIGGISYFHEFAYDLLSENEKIISNSTDVAIKCFQQDKLKRVVYLSSSMVFESTNTYPSTEESLLNSPPPISSYGFQKLSVEYFAKAAYEQYGLEYAIARPFNCVGIGEIKAKNDKEVSDGSKKLALSHVVPDFVLKTLESKDHIEILGSGNQIRHYTYGEDLAEGICLLLDHENAKNNDFNISTSTSTSVLELAEKIWKKIKPDQEFKYINVEPFEYDVQKRIPSTDKAKTLLDFEAKTSLDEILDIVIPWITKAKEKGYY
mgnify:FL=1|tara:strand:+ start:11029 stop:12051 length:1023 start_codon:yes stop_codon:yes gene_type:complete